MGIAFLAGLLTLVVVTPDAIAQVPHCSQAPGIRGESYAYGVHSAYMGRQIMPTLRDDTCYAIGHQHGSQLRAGLGAKEECGRAYQDGYQQAFAGSDHVVRSSPDTCFMYGYLFGLAWLKSNARDQRADLVGASCAGAYLEGFQQGKRMAAPKAPSDKRDAFCYLSGHTWASRAE